MKSILLAAAIAIALAFPFAAHGHGGGLDSNGGHNNRKTGTYHYHQKKAAPAPEQVVTRPVPRTETETEPTASDAKTDDDIRKLLVENSIARYSGNCPCPYNVDRAGRRCGKRSAYSRPGGASPLCYTSDVSDRMVDGYRTRFDVPEPSAGLPGEHNSPIQGVE